MRFKITKTSDLFGVEDKTYKEFETANGLCQYVLHQTKRKMIVLRYDEAENIFVIEDYDTYREG